MAGMFQLSVYDGEYTFRLLAPNHRIILVSERFKTKGAAKRAMNLLIEESSLDGRILKKTSEDGQHYFVVLGRSGGVIASSGLYETTKSLEREIDALKETIAGVVTEEQAFDGVSVQRVGSVRTLLERLERIDVRADSVLLFRGHSDASYKLVPSIYREEGWIKNESILFRELILRCPNDFVSSESTFQTLVKMQHYSLPTRLLDVTANPLVALYFACQSSDSNGEVVVFRVPKSEVKYYDSDTVSVISNISRCPADFTVGPEYYGEGDFNAQPKIKALLHEVKKEKPYFEPLMKRSHVESVVCVKPMLSNPRIIKQDGAFLLFGVMGEKSIPAKIPEHFFTLPEDQRIFIKAEEKLKMLEQLESLGITYGSIFPEIESVASHIKNSYKKGV